MSDELTNIPSEDTLQKFIDLQTKELQLRTKEFALRQAEIDHSAKYAEKTLDAQLLDRKDEREHRRRISSSRNFCFVGLFLAVLCFGAWALYLDKDEIVLEALKLIGSAAIGFSGGYYYGRGKAAHSRSSEDSPSE